MERIFYNAMLSRIQKEIIKHKEEIERIRQIDLKHCKIKVEVDRILEIIEFYKKLKIENIEKQILVYCNGNPYIVINLAMISILNNISIKVNIDKTMIGVNRYILEIIKNISKENNLKSEIKITENINYSDNIICIDKINEYNILKKNGKEAKYIPYQSLDIYSDSEEFNELFENIYNYAISVNIDVDIFEEEGIYGLLKYGKGKYKLILTKNNKILEKYKNKNVYINENPFKEEKVVFDKEIIKDIIK